MNYKLAKQLKDAGFPQNRHNHFYPVGYGVIHSPIHYDDIPMEARIVVPTLSQLINACKKDLESIMTIVHYRHYSDDKIVRFEAIGIKKGEKKAGVNAIINEREGGMKEVIALLYLKLNK